MKKLLLILALVVSTIMSVRAEYTGDGFYRVHNYDTDRYIYVYDNKGSIDLTATTVDLYAIQLWKGRDRAISDPGSVLYVEKHGNQYDIKTQGTGIYQMINAYLSLRADSKVPGTYWAYGSSNGLTKYLCDGSGNANKEQSWLVGEGTARRNWYVTPIDAGSDNYFGLTPTVAADGANWAALYADFSFSLASQGMETYWVKTLDAKRKCAIIEKVDEEWVNNSVPVIVKCSSDNKSGNRLNLAWKKGANPGNANLLHGVYFNYSDVASHTNRVKYDKKTMRVLGLTKDGHVGLVTANIDYVPRNSVYINVDATAPEEFRLVTNEEYRDIVLNEKPEPEQLILDKTDITMTIGDTETIGATVLPADATTTKVTWSTSNKDIVTVDANGNITACGVGQATITAKCATLTATCKVTVKAIPVESITLSTTSLTLLVGESGYINAIVAPENATDKTVTWTSSDPQVASVSADGKVEALRVGTAIITASCGAVKATCEVTVKDIEVEEITLSEYEISLKPGMTAYLYSYVKPTNAKDQTVVWTSSDPEVATVSEYGTVKAIKPGVADVTATCGKVSATCKVNVLHTEPTSVSVNPRKAEVDIDSVFVVKASVSPSTTTRPVIWSSSDETVITVYDNGDLTANVKAMGAGEADIVVNCGALNVTCHVKVNEVVGITDIEIDSAALYDVYNLQGVMVRRAGALLEGLPHGVYIINGQKYLIK